MSLYNWDTTAANNDNADGNINWAEGQNSNTVNNSARAQMAAVAAFLEQINGSGTSAGSTDAYTFTSASGNAITAYAAGNIISFTANAACTGTCTLNVDTLGAKTLKKYGDTNLAANDIETGDIVVCIYDGTNFQVINNTGNTIIEAIAALTGAADKGVYFTSSSAMATMDFPSFGRTLVANTSAALARADLDLEPGTDVQVQDAALQSLADTTWASGNIVYTTGSNVFAASTITAAGRAILDDASAAAQLVTLGIPTNTRDITYGTGAPGALGDGEIYIRHD